MVEYVKLKDEDSPKKKGPSSQEDKPPIITLRRVVWSIVIIILLSILISSCAVSIAPKIAVVPISGELTTSQSQSLFDARTSSRAIANQIYTLADDNSVRAIILDINSPGGSPVASDEIAQAVMYATELKPVHVVFSDLGASGAYWVAASATKIYSAPLSIVGSIGVTSATLSFENFIEEWNISYRAQVAGEFKDMGSPFREQREEEIIKMQELLDTVHVEFIEHIANSRNMSIEEVTQLATGEIFLGREAVELGLVDELGYIRDVIENLEEELGSGLLVMTFAPSRSTTLFSILNPLSDLHSLSNQPIINLR